MSKAKKIIIVYLIGGVLFLLLVTLPVSIPCIFAMILGFPCPACGMTRAFTHIFRLRFVAAFFMNIAALPLFIGSSVYFWCAVVELISRKRVLCKFEKLLFTGKAKIATISLAASVLISSGVYNFLRDGF